MEELRTHPRHKVLIPAEAATAENSSPVDVVEISIEGLRLQSKKNFSPETIMSVTIIVGRFINFNGWVVWVLDKYLTEGHVYHTGIRIESITDDTVGMIGIEQREDLIQEIIRSANSNRGGIR